MTGETVLPHDLAPLKQPLIDAVVYAYMAKKIPELTGFQFHDRRTEDGEVQFRYDDPEDWAPDTGYYVTYPGGVWKRDDFWSPDPTLHPGDEANSGDRALFDAVPVYNDIAAAVSNWVDPWIDGPDPNTWAGHISNLADIATKLYIGEAKSGTVTGADGSSANASISAVTDLRSAIDDSRSDLGQLRGASIQALEHAYTNDIEWAINGQCRLAVVATLAVTGEAVGWASTYSDLKSFFTLATSDLISFAESHGASGNGVQNTLSAVSSVSGIVSGVSVEAPPVAIGAAIVSGLAGLASTFWPSEEAKPAVLVALKGDNYDDVWQSFCDAVLAINQQLYDAEEGLGTMCNNVINDVNAHPDSYSIVRKDGDGKPQPHDDLKPFLTSTIVMDPTIMRNTGGRIESIGLHQLALAKRLGNGAGGASDAVATQWDRPLLFGWPIGWGYGGHFTNHQAVIELLADILVADHKIAHQVAEHCYDTATGFSRTDHQIEVGLGAIAKTFDTVPD